MNKYINNTDYFEIEKSPTVENYLNNERATAKTVVASVNEIVSKVCGIPSILHNKGRRKRHLVEARNIAYYFIRKYTNYSMQKIGDIFGKNHATVLNGLRNHDNWYFTDCDYMDKTNLVFKRLKEVHPMFKYYDEDLIELTVAEQLAKSRELNMKLMDKQMFYKQHIMDYEKIILSLPENSRRQFNEIRFLYYIKPQDTNVEMVSKS